MEKSYTNYPSYGLVEIRLKLRIIKSLGFNIFKKNSKIILPDSAYGEWLILENNIPKFYFNSFKEDGELNNIALFAKNNNLDFETFLINLLQANGYKNIKIGDVGLFPLYNKSHLEDFDLLQLVEV